MILTDVNIRNSIKNGDIVIEPLNESRIGTNSVDVTLGDTLLVYEPVDGILDFKKPCPTVVIEIPDEGFVLLPNKLYLANTAEYTESHKAVPMLIGCSSTARLGLDIHKCAGFGDVGFKGNWTLELAATQPVRIYKGMKIGQIYWLEPKSKPEVSYGDKVTAKYQDQTEPTPYRVGIDTITL